MSWLSLQKQSEQNEGNKGQKELVGGDLKHVAQTHAGPLNGPGLLWKRKMAGANSLAQPAEKLLSQPVRQVEQPTRKVHWITSNPHPPAMA